MTESLTTRLRNAIARRRYRWFHQAVPRVSLPGGVASFTFDDSPATAALAGAQLLEAAGWRGKFYLSPGLLDSDSECGRIASGEDVLRLRASGHEIGSHTYTHRRCVGVSTADLLHEDALCAAALRTFGNAVSL